MNHEPAPYAWLTQPESVNRAFAAQGLLADTELPLRIEKAWPYRERGFLMALRTRSGARWAIACPAAERLASVIAGGLARGVVVRLEQDRALAWQMLDDPALAEGVPGAETGGARLPVTVSDARVIGYKPLNRRVLRFQPSLEQTLIAKQYAGQRAPRIARIYAEIAPADRDSMISIPLPGGLDEGSRGVLTWPASNGSVLLDQLRRAPPEALMRRAAEVLGHLHGLAVQWTGRHTVDDELAVLRRWTSLATRADARLDKALRRRLDVLEDLAARLAPGRVGPCHRDFYDKQILLDGARSVLLDLDTACLGDPELDAANFAAHLYLRELQGGLTRSARLAREFVSRYEQIAGPLDRDRFGFYEQCTRLRLACVYLLRQQWTRLATRLIDASSQHRVAVTEYLQ